MLGKIRKWYQGVYVPFENDAHSSVVFMGGSYDRHWTANLAHICIEFYRREWKWVWGAAFVVVGMYLKIHA